jgi:hypothetical protein
MLGKHDTFEPVIFLDNFILNTNQPDTVSLQALYHQCNDSLVPWCLWSKQISGHNQIKYVG